MDMKLSQNKPSVLALDWGTVRIGVAVSPDGTQAFPRDHILVSSAKDALVSIKNICKEDNVGVIVIGLPLNMKGDQTDTTREVKGFAETVRQAIGLPVVLEDERLTSIFSEKKRLFDQQKSTDSLAALAVLENYIAKQ